MRCGSGKIPQSTLKNPAFYGPHIIRCRNDAVFGRYQSAPIRTLSSNKSFSHPTNLTNFQPIPTLPNWDLQTFRERAFIPKLPALLPEDASEQPPASQSWFHKPPQPRDLDYDYLRKHAGDCNVPLELTRKNETGTQMPSFERFNAPLQLFLDWMRQHSEQQPPNPQEPQPHLYLAQCSLTSLPQTLLTDLPTPSLVLNAGKSDLYDSNIWIGVPPTYTPLHRDPNPNFFLQLAGRKAVRLFPPEVGRAIYGAVQERLGRGDGGRGVVWRGEEMMQGAEREVLERVVWGAGGEAEEEEKEDGDWLERVGESGYEATVEEGNALFIPLGWWHSIKGVGSGTNASVNWWFR